MKKMIKKFLIILMLVMLVCTLFQNNITYARHEQDAGVVGGPDGDSDGDSGSESDGEFVGGNKEASNWIDIFNYADNFINKAKETTEDEESADNLPRKIDIDKVKKNAGAIYNILLAIGTILTVVIGGVLGIQFMFASAEQKAQIKEKMIPFVIGCIVIYGGFIIWKLIVDILDAM